MIFEARSTVQSGPLQILQINLRHMKMCASYHVRYSCPIITHKIKRVCVCVCSWNVCVVSIMNSKSESFLLLLLLLFDFVDDFVSGDMNGCEMNKCLC